MDRDDRFVLSKGHAAGALYITLNSIGRLSDEQLDTFCRDNTSLPAHPSGKNIPGVLFSTGSLGHGPSLSAGLALALRQKGDNHKVFCLCSDGEWQEGSCWEALIFAVHHKLERLTILVDQNGLQAFGRTSDVASITDLAPRFKAFGASVITINGHDTAALIKAVSAREPGKPHVIVMNTRKGRGLHFENMVESHYLPLTADQYEAARSSFSHKERS
jgi:transketolase